MSENDKAARDNRANQLNPEHDAYWQSRGEERPVQEPSEPVQPEPPDKSRE